MLNFLSKKIDENNLCNLFIIAASDGVLDEYEIDFLSRRGKSLGIAPELIQFYINKADSMELCIPKNEYDREEQLLDAVYIAMLDGNIMSREYFLCTNLAGKLGFKPDKVDEIIEEILNQNEFRIENE